MANNANLTRKTSSYQLSALSQIRWASQVQGTTTEEGDKINIGPAGGVQFGEWDKETGVVYHAPSSRRIKQLKLLSLCACCLSVSLVRVLNFFAPDIPGYVIGAVVPLMILLSACSIATLHRFVSPYIHKLQWVPGSDSFKVERLSWLATHNRKTIKFADIRPPETNIPFVTFEANGQFYFVDPEHCHNKALLARLTPQSGGVQQSEEGDKETEVIYHGPNSSTIKEFKHPLFHACFLLVSCLGQGIIFAPDMNVILKGAIVSSMIFVSASIIASLHWFVSSYIHKLRWVPGSDSFEVEMMSWRATDIQKTIKFADIRPPETTRPCVTFKANCKFYFVDTQHCHSYSDPTN